MNGCSSVGVPGCINHKSLRNHVHGDVCDLIGQRCDLIGQRCEMIAKV